MSIKYTWSFPRFDVVPSEDGLVDVVKTIYWQYVANDGDYHTQAYGAVNLGLPNPTNFIPYSELTREWTINAVSASVDVEALEAALAQQIEILINPPFVPMQPPF